MVYLDNDQLNQPVTGSSEVYTLSDGDSPLTKEHIFQKYPQTSKGFGLLDGEYHIRLDSPVEPVQHAPRRVPVALRGRNRKTLNELVKQDILAPVHKMDQLSSCHTQER